MNFLNNLKSTTWEERNISNLNSLFSYLAENNIDVSQKKIVIIGPGGIVKFLSPYLPKGAKNDMKTSKKIQYLILRQFEGGLRKTGKFKLKSFEISEILSFIKKGEKQPQCLYVADCEKKILDTIDKETSDIEIKPFLRNIEKGKASENFDIVVCYNVIQRLDNPDDGMLSIIDSLSDNGLISLDTGKLDINLSEMGLTKVADNLYQKKI